MLRKCQNTPRINLMQFSIHLVYILGLQALAKIKEKPRNLCGCRASVLCARQDSNLQPADP